MGLDPTAITKGQWSLVLLVTVLLTTISAVVTVAAFPDSGDDGPTSDYTIALILQIVAFLLQIGLYASIQDAGPLAGKIAGKIGMILGILGLLLALVANALSWYHISDIAGAQIMMSAMAEMAAALGGDAADAVPDFTVSLYFSYIWLVLWVVNFFASIMCILIAKANPGKVGGSAAEDDDEDEDEEAEN